VTLLERVTEIKLFSNSSFELVVDSVAALAPILTLKAALGSLSFVLAERTREPIRTIAALSFLLGAFAIVGAEMREFAFAGDATNLGCLVLTPLTSEQMLRIKKVSGSSAVAEAPAASSKAVVLLEARSSVVAVLTSAFVQLNIALNASESFGANAMHSVDFLLLEEVEVVNFLVFFGMILEAVDALTTLLTLEITFALLFGDDSVLLHLAMRALVAIGAGALLIDVRCIIAAGTVVGAEPAVRLQPVIGCLAHGRSLVLTVLSGEETIGGGTVTSPLAVVFLFGAFGTIKAGHFLIADLIFGLAREAGVLVVFGAVAVISAFTGDEIGIQCVESTQVSKAFLADGPVLAGKWAVGLLRLYRRKDGETEGQCDQECRRRSNNKLHLRNAAYSFSCALICVLVLQAEQSGVSVVLV